MNQNGTISIHAQNIMPIIKKWLYSDKDIFIREVISNANDAIVKRHLAQPEFLGQGRVTVQVDEGAGVLRFIDNGIGMTDEEVRRYINQVAFSSAEEFLKQYDGADNSGIIGHFGLGFYSTFMVSSCVTIDTLSYQEGARAVRWQSGDGLSYDMSDSDRTEVGTTITLTISDEEHEFLHGHRVREVLEKYCAFMSVPIFLEDAKEKDAKSTDKPDVEIIDGTGDGDVSVEVDTKRADEHEHDKEDISDIDDEDIDEDDDHDHHHDHADSKEPKPINETRPLWLKDPKDCTDDEYKDFYYRVFREYEPPLFWVHLNVDHPFRLRGILYFPKLRQDITGIPEGPIKLFSGQVFVADNIKEVIPEFLTLLKGAIDCPDIPLNVSRSFLQNDGYVKKLSSYITRKVADRLKTLFNKDRESYEKYWEDINPFIKFGCMKDEGFYDQVKDILIFQKVGGGFITRTEYLEKNKEKAEGKIYYATDASLQTATIALYQDQGIDVVQLDSPIDVNFISFMEYKDYQVKYSRVDADLSGLTSGDSTGDLDLKRLEAMFRDALDKKELAVTLESFKDETIPAVTIEEEQMRRLRDMSRFFGRQEAPFPSTVKLALNARNVIIRQLAARDGGEETFDLCRQIFDLAEMSRQPLEPETMRRFIARSHAMMARTINA